MNLPQNQKTFQVIIIAVVFFLLAMIFGIFLTQTGKSTKPAATNKIVPPQVSPASLPKETKDLKSKLISKPLKNNKGDLLLYESTNFYVEYITSPQVFFVKIAKDVNNSKKQATEWFIAQGATGQDMCNLPVRFILSTLEARQEDPKFTSLPDGCTGQPISKPTK